MAKKFDMAAAEQDILTRLDIQAEYSAMGVAFASDRPRSSGMIECFARSRDEKKPSAAVNTNTGRYIDSASGENLSLWDFAARYGGFSDWRAARQHFADKAGVKLRGGKAEESPLDQLEFIDWTEGNERLAALWCAKHKKGASVEAFKLAGGRVGHYPTRIDKQSGQKRRGEFKILGLPCYGHKLTDADPIAWVIWNISGGGLPVYRQKGTPPEMVKMKSIGDTRGAMMNLHSLSVLSDDSRSAGVDLIWKSGGPSDMLAIQAAILRDSPEFRDSHLVLTNASGETGDILPHQAALFAGRRAVLCGDTDEAGVVGVDKWREAIANVAASVQVAQLPFAWTKKHGKDARDFLNGEPCDLVAESAASDAASSEASSETECLI